MSITIGMMILFGIKMTNKTSKLGTTNRRDNNTVFSVQFKAQIFLSMDLLMLEMQLDWCQDPCLIFVLKTPRIMRETTTKYLMVTIVETVKRTAFPVLTENFIIIMDKEKNQLVSGTEVPKLHKMKKQECLDCLVSKDQVVDCVMSAIELKSLVMK